MENACDRGRHLGRNGIEANGLRSAEEGPFLGGEAWRGPVVESFAGLIDICEGGVRMEEYITNRRSDGTGLIRVRFRRE